MFDVTESEIAESAHAGFHTDTDKVNCGVTLGGGVAVTMKEPVFDP